MSPSQVKEKKVETVLEDSEMHQNLNSHFLEDEEEEDSSQRKAEWEKADRRGFIWPLAETVLFYSLPAPA